MKVYSFKFIKQDKYMWLSFKLSAIMPHKKQALLREYFNMCKIVYRIHSQVAYTLYTTAYSFDAVRELYNEDKAFAKMVEIVKTNMVNLFKGTDPYQGLMEVEEITDRQLLNIRDVGGTNYSMKQ